MEPLPNIKPPEDFTGIGTEIIGNPSKPDEQGTLHFRDGSFRFLSLAMIDDPDWTPETAEELEMQYRIDEVESLAEKVRFNPEDKKAASALKNILKACKREIPRPRRLERAAKAFLSGEQWPTPNRREQAALAALRKTARELKRPPSVAEVVSRMKTFVDAKDGFPLVARTEENSKHLSKILREIGFGWLRSRPSGRPKSGQI